MVTDHNLYISEKIFESNGGMPGNISCWRASKTDQKTGVVRVEK